MNSIGTGPNLSQPAHDEGQAQLGISRRASEAAPNGVQEHGEVRVPRDEQADPDGEPAVGPSIISRRTDLTLVDEDESTTNGLSNGAISAEPHSLGLDSISEASVVEDNRFVNELRETKSQDSAPAGPQVGRKPKRIFKEQNPRGRLFFLIEHVTWQLQLQRIAKSLRNPSIGENLCKFCDNLNLRIDDFVFDRRRTWKKRADQSFGYLRDINARSEKCRLCRLVINAFKEQLDPKQNLYGTQDAIAAENLECRISWPVDGSQVVMDEHGESIEIPKTRCICVQWPNSRHRDAYLVLAFPNTVLGPERPFLGRFLSSIDKNIPEKLKEWYNICRKDHDRCKHGVMDANFRAQFQQLQSEPFFGVVDLDEMRLTSLPAGEKYAALSYVWGDKRTRDGKFKTKMEYVDILKEKNGVAQFFDQLPLTIQDATKVVRSIGLKYLWVDALSIIQDDEEFWSLNAPNMHLIYGNAEITIYAADGDGGNSGIKAFQPLPGKYDFHYTQHIEYIKEDLNLMVWNPFETYLERSTWNTRAWTFQEFELSQRRLVFVEGRAYFQCPTTTMSLDKYSEDTTPRRPQSALEKYRESVSQYSPRKLTHERDVEVAFSGIATVLCKSLGGEQLFSLPTSHFDWAILWQPESAPVSREPAEGERFAFPSWSWCGWKSTKIGYSSSFTAGCEIDIHDWLMRHTWISWYVRDKLGNLNVVWKPSSQASQPQDARVKGYRAVKHNERDSVCNDEGALEKPDQYGRILPPRLQGEIRDSFARTMPRWPFNVRTNAPDHVSTSPYQRFLQFWTWSAIFSIVPEDNRKPLGGKWIDPGEGLKRFEIRDGDSEFAGSIVLSEDFIERRGRQHEFIALSEARPFANHEAEVWNHFETSQKEGTEWYLYYVMLLEYEDGKNLVARRAGLGKMYKRAFDRPAAAPTRGAPKARVWKEIILG